MMKLIGPMALLMLAAASAEAMRAPANIARNVGFFADVARPVLTHQKERRAQTADLCSNNQEECCNQLGGEFQNGGCRICPSGDADEGCCVIDLDSFAFTCEICETLDEVEECANVDCEITGDGGFGCNGCGDYSAGRACFNFDCASDNDCVCNQISWDGKDCGACVIEDGGNPVFDCSAVGGPDALGNVSPAPLHVRSAGTAMVAGVVGALVALA